MLTLSTERFIKIQKEAPEEYRQYLVQVTKSQSGQNCKVFYLFKQSSVYNIYTWFYFIFIKITNNKKYITGMDCWKMVVATWADVGPAWHTLPSVCCTTHHQLSTWLHLREIGCHEITWWCPRIGDLWGTVLISYVIQFY